MIEFFGIISLCLLSFIVLLSVCLFVWLLIRSLMGVFHDN